MICISINVAAIITTLCSLDLRKERLYLIRTVEKLNVCSGGNFLMKGSNSLDSLFADSQKSLLAGTACQLYKGNGPWQN